MPPNQYTPTEPEARNDRRQRFYDFLKEHPIGVLSTVTTDGRPHGVVIYFAVNKDLVVSFITRAETQKNDDLKHNTQAMLTVFEPVTQAVLQVVGEAISVEAGYDVNEIAQTILVASLETGNTGLPPAAKLTAGPFVGYRLLPKEIRMAVYGQSDSGDYAELFESLQPYDDM